jgi:hypothetical protein
MAKSREREARTTIITVTDEKGYVVDDVEVVTPAGEALSKILETFKEDRLV